MPLKDREKQKEYIRNYMRRRYKRDREFRERMKEFNRTYQRKMRNKVEFHASCDWCFQIKGNCKWVFIIKYSKEIGKGKRKICRNCRKYLKGQYVLNENAIKFASPSRNNCKKM